MPDFSSAALSSIDVATATPHSSALHMKQSFCVNVSETYYSVYWKGNLDLLNIVMIGLAEELPEHDEMYELLDDCMSFPGLMVKVRRHCRAVLDYLDENFEPQQMVLEGDLSELLQHEYDHLDGILATMRAVDNKSLILGQMKRDL